MYGFRPPREALRLGQSGGLFSEKRPPKRATFHICVFWIHYQHGRQLLYGKIQFCETFAILVAFFQKKGHQSMSARHVILVAFFSVLQRS